MQAGGLLAWWVSVAGKPRPGPPLGASGRTGALALVLASSRAKRDRPL